MTAEGPGGTADSAVLVAVSAVRKKAAKKTKKDTLKTEARETEAREKRSTFHASAGSESDV